MKNRVDLLDGSVGEPRTQQRCVGRLVHSGRERAQGNACEVWREPAETDACARVVVRRRRGRTTANQRSKNTLSGAAPELTGNP